jgi:hypothetical protein
MRIALVLLTAVLLPATVLVPASSATKYKPCTLLTTSPRAVMRRLREVGTPWGLCRA